LRSATLKEKLNAVTVVQPATSKEVRETQPIDPHKQKSMKVVILAGGYGTRLAEETELKPKPMVEIGGYPILWHILKHYAHFGHSEFLFALGYKGDEIKRYFLERTSLSGDMTIRLAGGGLERHPRDLEDWTVHLVETGLDTNTGGRVRQLESMVGGETFLVTYGDGVSDVDLRALLEFHKSTGRLATVTAVRPPARFGGLIFDGDLVARFTEKPQSGEGWINGGYLVFEPGIFRYLTSSTCSLEGDALERLALDRQLAAYRHDGFWQCMDTLRDKRFLEGLWRSDNAPWKVWART
jgi:glucose-1-phosphate cytidylyltransferase